MRSEKSSMKNLLMTFLTVLTAGCGSEDSFVTPPAQDVTAQKSLLTAQENKEPIGWTSLLEIYPRPNNLGVTGLGNIYKWMQQIALTDALDSFENGFEQRPIIAVFDSGVDYMHQAFTLNGALFQKPESIQTQCKDDRFGCNTSAYSIGQRHLGDGNIFPYGTTGAGQSCRKSGGSSSTMECSHGTHVSGVIAGFDPGSEIFGVCPMCLILPIKVVGPKGDISDDAITAALQYITDLRRKGVPVRIVNSSFGKLSYSAKIAAAIQRAPELKDNLLIIAAAGNENTQLPAYPASLSNVIAVANVNSSNLKKDGKSNFGAWVDVAAPVGSCIYDSLQPTGFGIVSSVPGGGDQCSNGTSIAAPVVTGVAGLILAKEPHLTVRQLRQRILQTADGEALYKANPDYVTHQNGKTLYLLGSGIVNARNAVNHNTSQSVRNGSSENPVVKSQCGTVAGSHRPGAPLIVCLILALPLLLASTGRKLERKTKSEMGEC
jgi:subtilisin family serine protease